MEKKKRNSEGFFYAPLIKITGFLLRERNRKIEINKYTKRKKWKERNKQIQTRDRKNRDQDRRGKKKRKNYKGKKKTK